MILSVVLLMCLTWMTYMVIYNIWLAPPTNSPHATIVSVVWMIHERWVKIVPWITVEMVEWFLQIENVLYDWSFVLVALWIVWPIYLMTPLSREMLIVWAVRTHNDFTDVRLYSDRIREFAYDANMCDFTVLEGSVLWVRCTMVLSVIFGRRFTLPMSLIKEGLGPKFDIPDLDDQSAFERMCTIGKLSSMFNIPVADISNDWQRGSIALCWKICRMRRIKALEDQRDRRSAAPGSFAQLN